MKIRQLIEHWIKNFIDRRNCCHHYKRTIADAGRVMFFTCLKCGKFKNDLSKQDLEKYKLTYH